MDVKAVPCRCIAGPEQYTAIGEFSRIRFLAAYPEQSVCFSVCAPVQFL